MDQQLDDFDLLESQVDPKDMRTMQRLQDLEADIEFEKTKIKTKYIFKYSFQSSDPMKITE